MSTECKEQLYRFLDGEMPAEEQGAFREHLASCESCSLAFQESLQLELLGQMALQEHPVEPPAVAPGPRRWQGLPHKRWVAGTAALAAGLVLLMLVPGLLHSRDTKPDWLTSGTTRVLEARLTYGGDGVPYQRFVPDRGPPGSPSSVPPAPLVELARLKERGDFHAVATGYLLHHSPQQARAFLSLMPASVDRDSDLAVLSLLEALGTQGDELHQQHVKQTHLGQALELLDGVLRKVPDHPQALWNRALVLREMGLTLLAAEAFDAVAARNEAGWSAEAAGQAEWLRGETLERGRDWKEAFAATRDLMLDEQARLPLDEAYEHPGIVRLAFYDVVRAAPSPGAVERLVPLAEALDQVYGGGVLTRYVRRVSERDFTHRAALARRHARLVQGAPLPDAAELEALRRSGEDDLYLGALLYVAHQRPVDTEELARVARTQDDPWMELAAEREQARREQREGAWWKAEQRLVSALETCKGQRLVYRCLGFERQLTDLYLELHRPADAFKYAWRGWARAKAAREWKYEQEFLQELADIARFQESFASARAYLEESLLRMPQDCEQRTHVHRNLAVLEWEGFRPEGARRSVDRALECELPLGLTGAMVLSDLARVSPRSRDADHLRRALFDLRRAGTPPGREALLLFIEGQFELARARGEGQALLWRAVELAERTPHDVDARKARAFAYGVLISDAGQQQRWSDALALVGRALYLEPAPQRCMLAVAVWHEHSVVLARGPGGELAGYHDARRTEPLRGSAAGLVPPELVAALRGCEHVDVLALPPVHGLTGLLPGELAWSYRVGRASGPPPRPEQGPGSHLVVTGVTGPETLGLPKLEGLRPPRMPVPGHVLLQGSQATPSRVLAAMVDASEVELHAHGMYSSAVSDASLVVLAPEGDGSYALTADRVRATRLKRAPLVLLATCGAARMAPYPHEPFSLPVAFIEAGARAVLASAVDIPDSAGAFFEAVRELVRDGKPPSLALKVARDRWMKQSPADARWLPHVLVFE